MGFQCGGFSVGFSAFAVSVALFCASHLACADDTAASAAGFVRVSVPAESRLLVGVPFEPFSPEVHALFADQMTAGPNPDRILAWNGAGYTIAVRAADGWRVDGTDGGVTGMTFAAGDAFFVENRQRVPQALVICGRVLTDASRPVLLPAGLSLFASPFAAPLPLDNFLPANPNADDRVTRVTADGAYRRLALVDGAWRGETDGAAAGVAALGEGLWFSRAGTSTLEWAASRPYDEPPATEASGPAIVGLHPDLAAGAIVLTIKTRGAGKAGFHILSRDVDRIKLPAAETPWRVLASNLSAAHPTLTWTDRLDWASASATGAWARFYLPATDEEAIAAAGDQIAQNGKNSGLQSGNGPQSQAGGTQAEAPSGKSFSPSGAATNAPGRPNTVAAASVIHVDAAEGNDTFDGKARHPCGNASGPKKTIGGGLGTAESASSLVLHDGEYTESLRVSGRHVKVRIEGNVKLR